MFRRELFSTLGRRSSIDTGHSKTPEPSRYVDGVDLENDLENPSPPVEQDGIMFEPDYPSSPSSNSDNENLEEEVVAIDIDNLEELDLDSDHSMQTTTPLSPNYPDTSFKKYEELDHFAILRQTIVFGPIFSDEERDYILANMEQVSYPPDYLLFSQGDLPSYIYVLVKGTVELIQTDVKGISNTLQKIFAGSVIGETDMYNNNRYEYHCVTCEEVEVLRVSCSILSELIKKNRRYELYLRRSICSRNWKQMMWINKILQGKDPNNPEDAIEINQTQIRRPRRESVQFTTDVIPASLIK